MMPATSPSPLSPPSAKTAIRHFRSEGRASRCVRRASGAVGGVRVHIQTASDQFDATDLAVIRFEAAELSQRQEGIEGEQTRRERADPSGDLLELRGDLGSQIWVVAVQVALSAGVEWERVDLFVQRLRADRSRQRTIVDGLKEQGNRLGVGVVLCDQ